MRLASVLTFAFIAPLASASPPTSMALRHASKLAFVRLLPRPASPSSPGAAAAEARASLTALRFPPFTALGRRVGSGGGQGAHGLSMMMVGPTRPPLCSAGIRLSGRGAWARGGARSMSSSGGEGMFDEEASFESLGLDSRVVEAVIRLGFSRPTRIQVTPPLPCPVGDSRSCVWHRRPLPKCGKGA